MSAHCETRIGSDVRTVKISGNTFQGKEVRVLASGGEAFFEGDINLGPIDEAELRNTGSQDQIEFFGIAITGVGFRWPGGIIPFDVDGTLPDQDRVARAIRHWERLTSIRFVPRTTQRNFVTFTVGPGCDSRVGMVGEQQLVRLSEGCATGNVIHEIGHVVGLFHEQSREDRDHFVTINTDNITLDDRHNFIQHITDGDDIGAYDYNSIMHYGERFFAINPAVPTIISPQPIGQRRGLSPRDVATVARMYGVAVRDRYIVGDWNGDGRDEIAVRRRHTVYLQGRIDDTTASSRVAYGNGDDEDQYLVGDWNGDGKDTLAARGGNGILLQKKITDSLSSQRVGYGNGNRDDDYLVGDWNGDGKDTLAIRRGNQIFVQGNIDDNTHTTRVTFGNGNAEDQYLVGDWDGDGKDSLAVRRGHHLHLQRKITDTAVWRIVHFGNGEAEDQYLAGDWNGDGSDTFAVRLGNRLLLQENINDQTASRTIRFGNG